MSTVQVRPWHSMAWHARECPLISPGSAAAGDSLVGCASRALVAGASLPQSVHVGMMCAKAIIENRFTADYVRSLLLAHPTPNVTKLPPLACT